MNNNNDKKMNWNKNNKHQNRITSKNNWIIWYWKMRRKRSKLRVVKISKQLKIRKLPSSRTVLRSLLKNRLQKTPLGKLLKKLLLKMLIKLFNKNPNLNNNSNRSILSLLTIVRLPNKPLCKNYKNSNNQLKLNKNNSKPQKGRYKRSSKYKKSKKYKFNHWSPSSLNTLTNKSTTFSPDMSVKFLPHCSIKRPVKYFFY